MLKKFVRLASCMLALLCASPAYSQEAMFRGDLTHTGIYSGQPIATAPSIKWSFDTDGRIISTPAVVNGIVYFGSADQYFYAVDAETGQQKWKFATEDFVTSSPAVSGGLVYFGSFDGKFYAVDAASGKLKWSFETEGERRFAAKHIHGITPAGETMPDFWDFYLSSPAVSNGVVYFGSGDGNVYALDASSGSLRWKFKTGNVVHTSPAIADGVVFIGSFDTYFYALDASTGKERWRFKTGYDAKIHNQEGITSSAAVVDGMVYFGCRDSHLYALSAKTGEKKWEFNSGGGWISNSPAVKDGRVYLATGSDRHFQALDAKTGAVVFSLEMGTGTFASPAAVGNMVYVAMFNGELKAIDTDSHNIVWSFKVPSPQSAAAPTPAAQMPAEKKDVKPVTFYDERVAGMVKRLDSGIFLSSPVVIGGVIYIGNTNGMLYALK